jgi:hypothetical protein
LVWTLASGPPRLAVRSAIAQAAASPEWGSVFPGHGGESSLLDDIALGVHRGVFSEQGELHGRVGLLLVKFATQNGVSAAITADSLPSATNRVVVWPRVHPIQ